MSLVASIMDLCVTISNQGKYYAFIRYFGHIDSFDISITNVGDDAYLNVHSWKFVPAKDTEQLKEIYEVLKYESIRGCNERK